MFTREDLTDEQRMFGRIAEDFMRTEVLPREEQIYAKDWALTRELLLKAGELDLLRVDIPEAYGGLGLDKVSSAYVGEKIGIMPSFAGSLGAHTAIGTLPLVYFGTEEQKAQYLPRLASGELIAAYALTEPRSGSDALRGAHDGRADAGRPALRPQRPEDVDHQRRLRRSLHHLRARSTARSSRRSSSSAAWASSAGREEPKLGLDGSSTTALILENVRVPVENVLGTIGEGHKVAFNILNLGRRQARHAQHRRREAGARPRRSATRSERRQFGKRDRRVRADPAEARRDGHPLLRRRRDGLPHARRRGPRARGGRPGGRAARVLKTIEGFAVECSINKVWTSEALAYVVDEAVQVYGGYGYSSEFPAERAYRDARITRIYEGTNEINRLIIPTRLLKHAESRRLD